MTCLALEASLATCRRKNSAAHIIPCRRWFGMRPRRSSNGRRTRQFWQRLQPALAVQVFLRRSEWKDKHLLHLGPSERPGGRPDLAALRQKPVGQWEYSKQPATLHGRHTRIPADT
ncbi:hypothetical protein AVEN_62736-1 [Araneus ventricosus]|uniref:Uncharacterized protein n=1 Tax=Araneus ventricosus TaxID=182803 RepID=A0A4Y2IM99_ARAVE|nr:hypothetical protein AVEN_62736-1 [Araneus ventricosus]